jgi:excinuclease ABC subunit A
MSWYTKLLAAVATTHGFSLDEPIGELTHDQLLNVLFGTGSEIIHVPGPGGKTYKTTFEGVIPNLERRYRESESDFVKGEIEKYMTHMTCPECKGRRLAEVAITMESRSPMLLILL